MYKRTEFYESDVSFTTSAVRTHAWSIFSGLSLSDVSVISAIALPLYLSEISNHQWYNLAGRDEPSSEISPEEMDDEWAMGCPWPIPNLVNLASNSTAPTTSVSLNPHEIMNEHERVLFRDPIWSSLDGSPLLESHERAISSQAAASSTVALGVSMSKPRSKEIPVHIFRVVVLGDQRVGKTALISQVNRFDLLLADFLTFFQVHQPKWPFDISSLGERGRIQSQRSTLRDGSP